MPVLRYKPGDAQAIKPCIAVSLSASSVEVFPIDSGPVRLELDNKEILTDLNAIARRTGLALCLLGARCHL